MDWERFIMMIVQRILEEQSPQSLLTIRGYYYELLTRLIPAPVILKEIVKQPDSTMSIKESSDGNCLLGFDI